MVAFKAFGHLLLGGLFSIFVVSFPEEVLFVLFGSLLPDIDTAKSTLGRYNIFNRFGMFRHRGKCHTILGTILLCMPFGVLFGVSTFEMILTGAVSHLIGDKLNSWLPRRQHFEIKLW